MWPAGQLASYKAFALFYLRCFIYAYGVTEWLARLDLSIALGSIMAELVAELLELCMAELEVRKMRAQEAPR